MEEVSNIKKKILINYSIKKSKLHIESSLIKVIKNEKDPRYELLFLRENESTKPTSFKRSNCQ